MAKNMKTAAEIILDILASKGVRYIFGIPGGASIPIYDALTHHPLELVLTRHEQGATHMADGYARATGKPGVVCVTSGPGATNTLTGLLTAQMDSVPMIVISGQSVRKNIGLDAFQEADVLGMSYPVVKHSYLIKEAADVPRVVLEALHIAVTGRPGPVLLDIPKDVLATMMEPPNIDNLALDLPGFKGRQEIDPQAVQEAAQMMSRAAKPVILAGHGVLIAQAAEELRALSEKMQIPVTTTLLGKGGFPDDHNLSLGLPGMHGTAYANKALDASDLIISIGSRWDDRITGVPEHFCPQARKIHFDIDPVEVGKVIPVDCAVIGDAKDSLTALLPLLQPGETTRWLKQINQWKREFPLKYRKEGKLRAQHVIHELGQMAEEGTVVSTDVGQHQMWTAQFWKVNFPRIWLSSGGAGTMGYGLPAAIGAQLACPDKQVVAVVGDGGFQMTMSELATAANLKLPLKILIINNRYLGMVRQWQHLFYENRLTGVDLEGNPDFVKLAHAFGIKAFRVKRSSDVRKTLMAALKWNDGPCLIEAVVEQHDNVFPMIPAGATLSDMIIEAPRQQRAATKQENQS